MEVKAVAEQPVEVMTEQAQAVVTEAQAQPQQRGPRFGYYWGTGRRKSAVARVRIKSGEGKFEINGKPVDTYFTEERDRNSAREPLVRTEQVGRWDVFITASGGGFHGQAEAVMLGVARALRLANPELEQGLRDHNLLTRDERKKERKHYGRRAARRSFQFSKR